MNIINRIFILIILLIYLINLTLGEQFLDDFNLPCSYHDSVDLRGSKKFENGSYLYDGILIPSKLVGIFNYHINYTDHRVPTEKHERGCICKIRTCIKWCCATPSSIIDRHNCVETNLTLNTLISFQSNNFDNITEDIYKHFYPMVDKKPCETIYPLQPSHPDYLADEWILYMNGSITTDNEVYSKDHYCMAANLLYNDTEYEVTPHLCFQEHSITAREALYNSTMLLSVPFMILTIVIYMLIPELRNLHGKSLSCYLLGLVIGYSIFGSFHIFREKFVLNNFCTALGYICYFSFMSAFFWLSVISFDLWWNFRGIQGRNRFNDKKRFLYYCLYAFGFPVIFLVITITAQISEFIPQEFKPQIGVTRCWFEVVDNWSATIYFFGPLLIIILFNIVMFVMTSWKIHRVQRELSKIIAKEDSRMNFNSERDQFGHFLRLFIIMGVTWISEIISYLLGPNIFDPVFYVTDICNAMQGFIIFALFVLKSKVKRLIIKRFKGTTFNRSSQYSCKTNSSHLNLTAIGGSSGPPTSTPLMEAPKFF